MIFAVIISLLVILKNGQVLWNQKQSI
jgi:hypothetical protein